MNHKAVSCSLLFFFHKFTYLNKNEIIALILSFHPPSLPQFSPPAFKTHFPHSWGGREELFLLIVKMKQKMKGNLMIRSKFNVSPVYTCIQLKPPLTATVDPYGGVACSSCVNTG